MHAAGIGYNWTCLAIYKQIIHICSDEELSEGTF